VVDRRTDHRKKVGLTVKREKRDRKICTGGKGEQQGESKIALIPIRGGRKRACPGNPFPKKRQKKKQNATFEKKWGGGNFHL